MVCFRQVYFRKEKSLKLVDESSAASLFLALVNNAHAVPCGINIHSRHDGGEWLWKLVECVSLQTAWGLSYVGCCQSAKWAPTATLMEQISKRTLSKPKL